MKILGTTERRTCEIAVKELELPCTVDEFHRQYKLSCVKNLGNVFLLKGRKLSNEKLNKFYSKNRLDCLVS